MTKGGSWWRRRCRRRRHRRRRSLRRHRRAHSGIARLQGRLPRTGRLGQPGRLPRQSTGVRIAVAKDLELEPQHAGAAGRLSAQPRCCRGDADNVRRCRWVKPPLRRPMDATAAVGLSRQVARRRCRRLANRSSRPRAVPQPHRPFPRRCWSWRRSRLPAAGLRDAAASAGEGRHADGAGDEQVRLALVAGYQRDPDGKAQAHGQVRPLGGLRNRLPGGRQSLVRSRLLAARDRRRRPAGNRRAGAPGHD